MLNHYDCWVHIDLIKLNRSYIIPRSIIMQENNEIVNILYINYFRLFAQAGVKGEVNF